MIAWTLDFQAPNFYRKMGFEEVVKCLTMQVNTHNIIL